MIASYRGKRAGLRIYNNRVTFLSCETDFFILIRLLIS